MHALIIEDQFVLAILIEDELRELGYTTVVTVDTESAAVASATTHCPDLIVADERLADGSGIAAIRVICAERHVPFVFVTSYVEEVRRHLPDAVAVPKPFSAPVLREAISRTIAISQGQQSTGGGTSALDPKR